MKKVLAMIPILLFSMMLLMQSAQAADYTNSIGMKFKSISAGSFYMGSCKLSDAQQKENKKRQFIGLPAQGAVCPSGAGNDKDASDEETPQHRVRISRSFQMGIYEVTLGQFKKFIAGAGRMDLLSDDFIKSNSHGDRAAVSSVSWNDAQSFIRWLNKKEGGKHYRLPSEAEWEYAARAGTTTPYSFKGQFADYTWYDKNAWSAGAKYAHAVGGKRPNNWGLYDTAGNVYEWVQDNWHDNYRGAPADGSVWGGGDSRSRVFRGSGWYFSAGSLRSAFRSSYGPDNRYYSFGFRLLRQP